MSVPMQVQLDTESIEASVPNARVYEVIYEGDFTKRGAEEDTQFSVSRELIHQWATDLNEMVAEGIDVPFPKGHTIDPTETVAKLANASVGYNSKGKLGLWATAKFDTPELCRDYKSAKVSLWATPSPLKSTVSDKTWKTPIRHIAFTAYPEIPGLEIGSELALSQCEVLVPFNKSTNMAFSAAALAALAQFGDVPEGEEAIMAFIEGIKKPESAPVTPPELELSQDIVEMRGLLLDSLVTQGKVPPAQRTKLGEAAKLLPNAAFKTILETLELSQGFGGTKTPGQGGPGQPQKTALAKAVDKKVNP